MKKILLLALTISMFAVVGMSYAGTASAANCAVIGDGPTQNPGSDTFYKPYLLNCSGVDAINIGGQEWYTNGLYAYHEAEASTTFPGWSVWLPVNCRNFMYPGTTFFIQASLYYQIHNSATHTWGSWHDSNISASNYLTCY